jgi:hypothetical protein
MRYDGGPYTETLAGPHRNVLSLKRLLISKRFICVILIDLNQTCLLDTYGYNEEDIVVMLDGGMADDPGLTPTPANLVSGTPLSVNLVTHSNIISWPSIVERDQ